MSLSIQKLSIQKVQEVQKIHEFSSVCVYWVWEEEEEEEEEEEGLFKADAVNEGETMAVDLFGPLSMDHCQWTTDADSSPRASGGASGRATSSKVALRAPLSPRQRTHASASCRRVMPHTAPELAMKGEAHETAPPNSRLSLSSPTNLSDRRV